MPIDLSCQLYSFRDTEPLDATLAMLARLGLRHVEPFGDQLADPAALRSQLVRHGLAAPSAHLGIAALRRDADAVMRGLAVLGTELAVLPYVAPELRPQDVAGWLGFAEELTYYGAIAARNGLRFAWHNHDFEFVALRDGSRPIDCILAAPGVLWQMDIAWLVRAGEDPGGWMATHGTRIASFHLKDLDPAGPATGEDGWADLGHGIIDWARLLPAMRATPTALWVLEHDKPADAARFATRSAATFNGWNIA